VFSLFACIIWNITLLLKIENIPVCIELKKKSEKLGKGDSHYEETKAAGNFFYIFFSNFE